MAPRPLLVAIVFVVVWGLITHGTFAGAGDEPHYLMIAHSIAFDGDLDLANDYRDAVLIGSGTLQPEAHAIPGKDGRLRPVHDIGLPLLAAPYVRIVYPLAEWAGRTIPSTLLRRARLNGILIFRHLISLAMALVTGLLAVEISALLVREGVGARAAMAWALLLALTPPLLSHSFLFFTEIPSALLVIWLFRSLSAPPGATLRWEWLGAATGLLLLIHVRNIALVVVFVGWALMRLRRERPTSSLLAFTVAAAVPLVMRSAAEWTFWGTLLTTPLAHADGSIPPARAAVETVRNVAGILADWNVGLLPVAPIYVLLFPGVALLFRRRRALAWPLVTVTGAYLLTLAIPIINVHGWAGGFAPAARMITPVVPILGIAVCLAGDASRRLARAVVIALIVFQVGIDAFLWQHPKRLWPGATTGSSLE